MAQDLCSAYCLTFWKLLEISIDIYLIVCFFGQIRILFNARPVNGLASQQVYIVAKRPAPSQFTIFCLRSVSNLCYNLQGVVGDIIKRQFCNVGGARPSPHCLDFAYLDRETDRTANHFL